MQHRVPCRTGNGSTRLHSLYQAVVDQHGLVTTKLKETMSNVDGLESAWVVHGDDELEGSLLPVAFQIQHESTGNTATPSVMPIAQFDYDTAIALEEQQRRENIAHPIPQNDRAAVNDDSSYVVKIAERRGIQAAEEEKELIRNTNRDVPSKDYFLNQALQAANEHARLRNFQGLQIDDKTPQTPVTRHDEKNSSKIQGENLQRDHDKGYEIKDYQVGTDYDTKDYNIHEYKSVYE